MKGIELVIESKLQIDLTFFFFPIRDIKYFIHVYRGRDKLNIPSF